MFRLPRSYFFCEVITMELKRENFSSGAPLEDKVGYSRMVKVGPYIKVGGTTSVQSDGTVFGDTPYDQTKYVLEKQLKLLAELAPSPRTSSVS